MKKVYIVGIGVGNKCFMHQKSIVSIEKSECLIGTKRMLDTFSYLNKETFESISAKEIYDYINNDNHNIFSVLVSGDVGFYSISKKLTEMLMENEQIEIENIAAVSSVQYFCSKLNLSWDGMKLVSAHGRNINIISNVMFNKKVFLLTGGEFKPNDICEILTSKGLGNLLVSVGENLSYENERIIEDSASNIAKMNFESLAVMIIQNHEALDLSVGLNSIKDSEFITGSSPMTKSEVRTISVSKLNLKNDSVVYDIGAGTGSVSIETALRLSNGSVYAIEKNEDAILLIKKNIEKFKAYNIEIIKNVAPDGLEILPKPDSVFIGGSSGNLNKIIEAILKKNPFVNLVINTITLENLNESLLCMEKYKFNDVEIINVAISKAKKAGSYNMMMGQNPIYIISGRGSGSN
ncbi:MAG: precorrin-6y C5,15-methyltransferase (decarboxylating) subunit CbiE [Sedimentibacter sp.]|uniref:precorrin-6y C5,15-methyltransferase (decarboxylating) subunit CbiE n=1 Tax=Sedimentibacter sp. TaxID=1960295 RepID=UPI002982699F|nr:precorrin-6y C5,15-methyltransferase (decarboxylating) subunit CbiE [Sedimentibacter sp.]MDW5298798.1 precorrin-6y C5,15-methyltransferase (decarboxylating) subunit CbiE [Sedimentibacter sp.]